MHSVGVSKSASPRILLAEDNVTLARRMVACLRRDGLGVEAVGDGESALALARANSHDVLLLDLNLPGMDGLSVLKALQDHPSPPAVILMSGYLDLQRTLAALERGAAEVVEKPVEPARLIEIVREVEERFRKSKQHAARPSLSPPMIPELIGRSRAMQRLCEQIVSVATYRDLPVMITGETGTGKDLAARAIHRLSHADGSFVALNCAAVPEELFESELFGHEAGAFTNARAPRAGLFEEADRGTIFLDEVGELPASQQAKLLRVLETRTFRRVGSNRELPLRARVVSATNRMLRGREQDIIRSDLFFRLAGYTVLTPPLRERLEDIELLAVHFLSSFASSYHSQPSRLTPPALEALAEHDWPGNVRELRSVVQYAAVLASEPLIRLRHVVDAMKTRGCLEDSGVFRVPLMAEEAKLTPAPPARPSQPEEVQCLPELERNLIIAAYEECGRNVSRAARKLGIPRTTLRDKLTRYGLR